MIHCACPRCGRAFELPDTVAGFSTGCTACGQAFQVPGPAAPPVTAPSLPPVRCQCPRCKQILEALAAHAGQKTNCPKCGQRIQLPAAPAAPPLNKTVLAPPVEEQPSPPMVQVMPLPLPQPVAPATKPRRLSVGLSIGLIAGISVPVLLLAGYYFFLSPPNARCPQCLTPCHIRGLERMNFFQKAAIKHRCPVCGDVDDVLTFEAMMRGGFAQPPPGHRIEDVIVPDR